MNERNAYGVLLIRAIESEDRNGTLLTDAERQRLARELGLPPAARPLDGDRAFSRDEEDYLERRASALLEHLEHKFPAAPRIGQHGQQRAWVALALPLAAFLLGAGTNHLGTQGAINILAFPLLGMLLWNLVVYALLALQFLRGSSGGQTPRQHGLRAMAARWMQPAAALALRHGGDGDEHGVLPRAAARFGADWLTLGAPLFAARAARTLHLAAALLALGAIAGMYARGLGFEYRAGWESTFLEAAAVQSLVGSVLAPASALTGIALPAPEQWAALRFSASQPGENAARWIHLYAVTAALLIVLPRLLLALAARLRERRLGAAFPLPARSDPYFRRLLAAHPGAASSVEVVPYSYHLSASAQEALRRLLLQLLGDGARLHFADVIDYGAEDEYLDRLAGGGAAAPDYLILLFSLAATPERETHALLCDGLAQQVRQGRVARRLLLLLDESSYRARLAGEAGAPARLEQRRSAWREVLHEHAIGFIDLGADDGAARAALNGLLAAPAAPREVA